MSQIKIYITAKREHANKIRLSVPDGFHCNARWIYMGHIAERPVTHWLNENFDDAIMSHFVIFYVEPGDKLKTSLLEVGNALAHRKQIFIASDKKLSEGDIGQVVLPHKDLDPWIGFEQIKYTGTLAQTFTAIKNQIWSANKINCEGLTEEQQKRADRNINSVRKDK